MSNILFDLDGTLITAKQKQISLLQALAFSYGIILDGEYVWASKSMGYNNHQILSNLEIDVTIVSNIVKAWQSKIETSYWLAFDTLFQDTFSSLTQLQNKGYRLYLATARSQPHLLHQQLKQLRINDFFNGIHYVSHQNIAQQKANYAQNIQAKHLIGDSENDGKAAKLADIPFSAVTTGQRSQDFLKSHNFKNIYDSLTKATQQFL